MADTAEDRHKMKLAMDPDLMEWLRWAGKHKAVTMNRYVNDLIRADMEQARTGAGTWDRFTAGQD
jgi:hypothetical protein